MATSMATSTAIQEPSTEGTTESTAPSASRRSAVTTETTQSHPAELIKPREPVRRSLTSVSIGLTLSLILLTGWLNALPWLYEGYTWCSWLGIALAMQLAISGGLCSQFWSIWLWSSCVLGAAFHWSPAAMQYTLSSSFAVGFAVAVPLIIWDGLRLALGFWLAAKITRDVRYYWFIAAISTMAFEYIMPGVFPWKLGLTQLSNPWFIQGIDVLGPSFSTFVAFTMAGAIQISGVGIYRWFNREYASLAVVFRAVSPVMITLACILAYNALSWQYWSHVIARAKKVKVGLIQVDPSYVESSENARKQTVLIANQVDLVCWPESSAGNYDLQLNCLADEEQNFLMSREPERGMRPWPQPHCELLLAGKNYVGSPDEPDELYVTAMLLDQHENIKARHNKRFLMPFGEYVPGDKFIPGLSQLFDMSEFVRPGNSAMPIEAGCGAQIGTMLCYEDMVPQAAREMVLHKANLLISLANGSAFESHFTLYQHRLIAHLRAVENRRYFLRCAATGETCVINPLGEIESRLPMQADGSLVSEVALLEGITTYSRYPWIAPLLLSTILCFSLAPFLRSTGRRGENLR